ncbi:MAG: polysaccharide deacetylase family protein [Gemmatimonadales bacterium]
MTLKHATLGLLTSKGVDRLWSPWSRRALPVLTLHRFADAERGIAGFPAEALRAQLRLLSQRGYRVLPLGDALNRLEAGEPLARAVVLTVDDGYADFFRVALPVLEEFSCPVTLFVTTGFVDGTLWMWWDQVAWVLERDGRAVDAPARVATLKRLPDTERRAAIAGLARGTGVTIPAVPPERYAPVTWDQLRAATTRGVTVGPHTVSHPILSRCDDAAVETEVKDSWERLRSECGAAALPVFCYPNGGAGDQSSREESILARLGFRAAFTTIPGFVRAHSPEDGRYRLPRFPHPASMPHLLQLASGLGRLRRIGSHIG